MGGQCGKCARHTRGYSWRRSSDELDEPTEVLSDRRKRELVLCATGATQSEPAKSENALQVTNG
jgi:hypothetical protein